MLESDRDIVHNQKFNVGASGENYQVKDVAKIISDTFPDCELSIGDRGGDKRDYRVNFDKIKNTVPGFECEWDVPKGAQQLLEVFDRIKLSKELFESPHHTRLKQINHLLETGQIDANFFWKG